MEGRALSELRHYRSAHFYDTLTTLFYWHVTFCYNYGLKISNRFTTLRNIIYSNTCRPT